MCFLNLGREQNGAVKLYISFLSFASVNIEIFPGCGLFVVFYNDLDEIIISF